MASTLDALLIGAGAYYTTKKLQDNDTGFERILIGAAVGIPAAIKGPELYESAKSYLADGVSQETKNRLAGSAVLGSVGYAVGNDLLGSSMKDDDKPYE
jgi:hypothetical protein